MKRITTILIGLALVISVNAQFQNSGGMFLRTGSSFMTAQQPSEPPGPVPPPAFLTSDGYTFSWLVADTANITLSGTKITALADIGPNNNDWVGNGIPGPQWDNTNSEIDFTNGDNAQLKVSTDLTSTPITVYIVIALTGTAEGREIFFFNDPSITRCYILQGASLNELILYAGSWGYSVITDTDGTYGLITATLNGASSYLQWNDNTPITGNFGSNAPRMLSIGYWTGNANMSIKELIIRSVAETTQNMNSVKQYLNSKYSLY